MRVTALASHPTRAGERNSNAVVIRCRNCPATIALIDLRLSTTATATAVAGVAGGRESSGSAVAADAADDQAGGFGHDRRSAVRGRERRLCISAVATFPAATRTGSAAASAMASEALDYHAGCVSSDLNRDRTEQHRKTCQGRRSSRPWRRNPPSSPTEPPPPP